MSLSLTDDAKHNCQELSQPLKYVVLKKAAFGLLLIGQDACVAGYDRLFWLRRHWMLRIISRSFVIVIAIALGWPIEATSTVLFDFDQIEATSKKRVSGAKIEIYMEGLYGSGLSVSPKTAAVHGPNFSGSASLSGPALDNSYLTVGKGRGAPTITINFSDNPIDSFSVDFKLFKKAKRFSILADGELIHHQILSKAQRKKGLSGQQVAFFFETPVHSLQFVGSKKKSFAIDNLLVDLPVDPDLGSSHINGNAGVTLFETNTDINDNTGGSLFESNNISQNQALEDTSAIIQPSAEVREPSSLMLFALGLFGFCGWWVRRTLAQ